MRYFVFLGAAIRNLHTSARFGQSLVKIVFSIFDRQDRNAEQLEFFATKKGENKFAMFPLTKDHIGDTKLELFLNERENSWLRSQWSSFQLKRTRKHFKYYNKFRG